MNEHSQRSWFNSDFFYLSLLALALLITYPELFFARSGSIAGDHIVQHYPWAKLLWSSLRSLQLPFWTPFIHCGFPIAAESQIGIFYPLNLLLFGLMPFNWAYSYINVLHFFVAAWGTYAYAKQMKLVPAAAFISSFIFVFGAAYGGAFYNITSLKTICWLPVALYLFESYYQNKGKRFLVLLCVVVASAVLAGYIQMAALMIFIFGLYCLLRTLLFSDSDRGSVAQKLIVLIALLFTLLGCLVLALPQLALTFELAIQSNRSGLTEEFSYVGSLSPFALSTFLVPLAQTLFRGINLYGGMLSLIFIFCAFFSKAARSNKLFWLWTTIVVISLLLALGEWSPVYVGFVKATKFYAFRTSRKFLVFICFGAAILAGLGFDQILRKSAKGEPSKMGVRAGRLYLFILSLFAVCAAFLFSFLTFARSHAVHAGRWILDRYYYGRSGHPHSQEFYYDKLDSYFEKILSFFSFADPWLIWSYVLLFLGAAFSLHLILTKKISRGWVVAAVVFLLLDLYIFSWRDIKRDFGNYESLESKSNVVNYLEKEAEKGNVDRIFGFAGEGKALPVMPSSNIFLDVEEVGVYSPLVMSRYYETIGKLGNINDSNASFFPDASFVLDRFNLLRLMGVSHILSSVPLVDSRLRLVANDKTDSFYLYETQSRSARALFMTQFESVDGWADMKKRLMSPNFDPFKTLLLDSSEVLTYEGRKSTRRETNLRIKNTGRSTSSEDWYVQVNDPGYFVVPNTMYPGWQATVNGVETPILTAYGLFQAIWLDGRGSYEIRFTYKPFRELIKKVRSWR